MKKRQKSKFTMEWDKEYKKAITLPEHVLRKQAEEFAERVRDGVNSSLGRDRLSISTFRPNPDQSIDILLRDADSPEGWDTLYLGWEEGCDAAGTIGMLLEGQYTDADVGGGVDDADS